MLRETAKTAGRYVLRQFAVFNASHAQPPVATAAEWVQPPGYPPALVVDGIGERPDLFVDCMEGAPVGAACFRTVGARQGFQAGSKLPQRGRNFAEAVNETLSSKPAMIRLKKRLILSVPLLFQAVFRDETKRCGVDAVSFAGGGGTVVKHVSQMGIPIPASHLGAGHE